MFSTTEVYLYRLPLAKFVATEFDATEISTNNWDHLCAFDEQCGWMTGDEFLAEARERIARGEQFQSIMKNGMLAHYGWLVAPAYERCVSEVGALIGLPAGSAYAYDFFTHPYFRNTGLYQKSLRHMIAKLKSEEAIHDMYIAAVYQNSNSRTVIEKIGFSHVCSLMQRQRWGRVRRWHTQNNKHVGTTVVCVQEAGMHCHQPNSPNVCFRIASTE